MSLIKLENRLIAFLDVLGFSNRLENDALEAFHGEYARFIDEAQHATFYGAQGDSTGRTNFAFAQFLYDSLVVVSHPIDDIYNVNHFVGAVALLMELGFKSGLPLRGAIGVGAFLHDGERNIFLSECLPKLVRAEKEQEWVGCIILGKAEDIVLGAVVGSQAPNAPQLRNQLLHRYLVPLKGGKASEHLAVNFLFFLSEKEIQDGIGRLIDDKKKNVQGYFDFLKDMPANIQPLPEEFAPARYCSMITTRTGVRAKFVDEHGQCCTPGVNEFTWVAVGRWK